MFCPMMFGQNKATVSLVCNPEGAAELSGAGTYNIGAKAEISVTTNPGYTFVNWTVDDEVVSTSMIYSFEVTGDMELTANLTQNHWMPNSTTYSDNMVLTAVVEIDGEEQRSDRYEIGAFCGDDVRSSQRLLHEYIEDNNGEAVVDRYVGYLTIYGKDNDVIKFKLYDHESDTEFDESEVSIEFVNNTSIGSLFEPYVLTFTTPQSDPVFVGNGSWSKVSNWKNSIMPEENSDVTVNGDAFISEEVTVNSLVINEGKSLTIQDGGVLTVTSTLSNEDVAALIIEDGGQIFQNNDNVAATFKKNIVNPSEEWGELDKTGWQFISSPMQNSLASDFVPESGDYDLFKYDGTLDNQWYNFKKTNKYEFENGFEGWTTLDKDGDGFNWELGDGYVYSASYDVDNDDYLAPDNYLVSPLINVDEMGSIFRFKACAEEDYYHEYCGVFVSEDGTNFTNIKGASWWIGEGLYEGEQSEWYQKEVSLADYSGKNIHVAIRHYNVEGSYLLLIDDIEFCRDGGMFENGIAYLASYETETVAEFKGILNKESSYKITASYSSSDMMTNYNLFGNPFSYNINWSTDVKLTGVNEGYAVVKADGGYEYKTEGVIKVGEGFIVNSAKGRTHNVTFQKGINAPKRKADNNSVNIIASGKLGTDNVILNFNENETSAFPKLVNFNDRIANVYVKENDTVFAIFNYDEDVKEIPLYFDAKEIGNYTLTFDVKGNYENLYLIDKMTGEQFNLLIENKYSFMANSNDRSDRFVLLKDNSQQTTDNSHFAYIDNGNIVISDIEGDAEIRIIDALGRCIYNGECSDEIHRVDAESHFFTSGVYMIQKIDDKGIKVQKIIL